jgi:hypothetical protein
VVEGPGDAGAVGDSEEEAAARPEGMGAPFGLHL